MTCKCKHCFVSFNLAYFPLIKTFCILLSKLTGHVFIIFTAYIVSGLCLSTLDTMQKIGLRKWVVIIKTV